MKKVILDFRGIKDKEALHAYLAEAMGFPAYYGKNLDALYDCLTDLSEPTAVGFFMPCPEGDELDIEFMMYLEQVKETFRDAESGNDMLAVIFGDLIGVSMDEDEFNEEALDALYEEGGL